MPFQLSDFQQREDEVFESKEPFITEDGQKIPVLIRMGGGPLEGSAVAFANDFLAHEMQIRRKAADTVFTENEYLKDFLEYETAEALLKALEVSPLYLTWEADWPEVMIIYLSPLDDLEDESKVKYVLMVASQDGDLEDLQMYLEQTP